MARTPHLGADASVAGNPAGQALATISGDAGQRTAFKRAQTLEELESQLTRISARFRALVESAGAERCSVPPSPGSWSVVQCLEHLNISSEAYLPVWQQIIADARPRRMDLHGPYPVDFWGRFLSWLLEPPARIRSKTTIAFEPAADLEIGPVLDAFLDRQQRIIAALDRSRGRAIDRIKMASPVDPRIHYSIWSSFLIVAAHQRRHLWQAEKAIQALDGSRAQSPSGDTPDE